MEYDTGGLVLIEVLRQDDSEHRVSGESIYGVRVPLEKKKGGKVTVRDGRNESSVWVVLA